MSVQRRGPIHYFEYFDPKEGTPPEGFFNKLSHIAFRARKILEARSSKEIVAIADVASWLLTHEALITHRSDKILESIADDDSEDYEDFGCGLSEAEDLLFCYENIELDFTNDISNLTWPEIVAAYALSLIADAAEYIHRMVGDRPSPIVQEVAPDFVGAYALDAMECVCLAESILRVEEGKNAVKKQVSSERQKAAYKRHAATNALKRDFISFWLTGEYGSMAEAARRFYAGLDPDRKKLLAPTNAERTLKESLSEYLKGVS